MSKTASMERRTFIKGAAAAAMLIPFGGLLTACSSNQNSNSNKATENTNSEGASSKILVAYYSGTGNTRRVAEDIAHTLNADIFEIVPQQPYTQEDLNFRDENSRVITEHNDESLRDIPLAQATPEYFGDYETVILGYPIWWAIAAWPTNHFAQDNNFTGKRVITFCTSASSGLGNSGSILKGLAGTGSWEDGQRFASSATSEEVAEWANSLGL